MKEEGFGLQAQVKAPGKQPYEQSENIPNKSKKRKNFTKPTKLQKAV